MPFQIVHFSHAGSNGKLALWSDDLPVNVLESMLGEQHRNAYQAAAIRLPKRRLEWLKTRILLDHLSPGADLHFLQNGKPVLDGRSHVSVSHSGSLAAVIVSDHPVGIDVQPYEPKLERIQSRFCNAEELRFVGSAGSPDVLAVIWAAKEAVFKYFGERVEFAREMMIAPFSPESESVYLNYEGRHGKGKFELTHLFLLGQHVLFTNSYTPD
jgi:phosphopantetheinyl transferase (holo-ACP synthase)